MSKPQKSKPEPRTVGLVRSSYQPTKVELREKLDADVPGETVEDRMVI